MKRRDFLRAAPIGLAASALPVAAMAGLSKVEQLEHHAAEVYRLLYESMPSEGKMGPYFDIHPDGYVMTTGPNGLAYRPKKGGWVTEGTGWGSGSHPAV